MKATPNMLSPCFQTVPTVQDLNLGDVPVSKLVPNLCDKTHYILRYHNLKLYLDLGVKLTKIHWALRFAQSKWLKSFIYFSPEKRKRESIDFEKDFFKVMNIVVWNLQKWVNVKLVTNQNKLTKATASPSFHLFCIFSEDLATVSMKKRKFYLNHPTCIFIGSMILDLLKVCKIFTTTSMVSKYASHSKLLFTDTDSLCYNVNTAALYRNFLQDLDCFDTPE